MCVDSVRGELVEPFERIRRLGILTHLNTVACKLEIGIGLVVLIENYIDTIINASLEWFDKLTTNGDARWLVFSMILRAFP